MRRHRMAVQFPALKTLMVIVLVLGNASPVKPVAMSVGAVVSAASAAISAGTSLAGTTLQAIASTNYKVTCTIQVENWTRYPLLYPTARINYNGALTTPATAILPGKKEAFAVRKPSIIATGVSGTVSWEVQGASRRLALMWSAPYHFSLYSNWMGLGMTRKGLTQVAEGMQWFNQMYYGKSSQVLSFKRGEFYRTTNPVIYRDDQFEIVGTMTSVHHAIIKVIFRPSENNWKDLAPTIRASLQRQSKRSVTEFQ